MHSHFLAWKRTKNIRYSVAGSSRMMNYLYQNIIIPFRTDRKSSVPSSGISFFSFDFAHVIITRHCFSTPLFLIFGFSSDAVPPFSGQHNTSDTSGDLADGNHPVANLLDNDSDLNQSSRCLLPPCNA